MGIDRRTVTTVSGRWELRGARITVGEFIRIGNELAKGSLDMEAELNFEPPGINGVGKPEPAAIRLQPYDPDAPKAAK
jgi:hypothetical protein